MEYMILPLKRYFEFNGRSRRLEYGLFFVFCLVVQTVISLIETGADPLDVGSGSGIVSGIFALAILVPSVTLTVRRLHDFNASGWWLPLIFFPTFVVLVALAGSSDPLFHSLHLFGPPPSYGSVDLALDLLALVGQSSYTDALLVFWLMLILGFLAVVEADGYLLTLTRGLGLMLALGFPVLVLLCFFKPGTSGGNRFGPDPKQREDYL